MHNGGQGGTLDGDGRRSLPPTAQHATRRRVMNARFAVHVVQREMMLALCSTLFPRRCGDGGRKLKSGGGWGTDRFVHVYKECSWTLCGADEFVHEHVV